MEVAPPTSMDLPVRQTCSGLAEASKDVTVIDLLYGWPLPVPLLVRSDLRPVLTGPGVYAFCGQYLNTTTIFHPKGVEKSYVQ